MNYSKAHEVSPIIAAGAPISSIMYRTRAWELCSATAETFDQVWIIFVDGRKRNLFKQEWLKLKTMHRKITITNTPPEAL